MSSQLGHSRDVYTYSILLAVRAVARALNARVEYVKVPRCSDKFSIVADALSQGQVEYAKSLLGEYAYGQYSSTLMKWLCDPVLTRVLGHLGANRIAFHTGCRQILDRSRALRSLQPFAGGRWVGSKHT